MKIGIDARLWDQTGVGRYIRNLCINLQKVDKKNSYVIFARSQELEIIKSKINNPRWKTVKADIRWHSISEQINFPSIIAKENLDLMHFPYFSLPIFYKKPYVVTIHDLIINHYPTGKASTLFPLLYYLKLFAYKFIIYKASKNAITIIVPSIATKNEVIDHLKVNNEKIAVTCEAADDSISNKSINNKYDILNTKYYLYVGNAYPHKNLENLIAAFNNFSKDKDVKLILAGKKDYFYKQLEQKTKSEKIIFYGAATDEQLSSLYKNALCLAMPSLMEGFGLPVLEAIANKCLIICSDIPSLREIAKDNALYFDPKNISQIEESMSKAYFGKYEKEIIQNAYNFAKKFSWEKAARETLDIYESSIGI